MAPVSSGLYLASTPKLFRKRRTNVKRVHHLFLSEIPHLELSGDFELVRINELVIIIAPVLSIGCTQRIDLSFVVKDDLAFVSCVNGYKSRFILIIPNH